jgi:Lon protease-like protein
MSTDLLLDYGRPIALLPSQGVVLLPYGAQPMYFFEPRYTQMIERCLAASSTGDVAHADPIAVAVLESGANAEDESPALKSAVCIGRIHEHVALSDGRHNVILRGVARASIDSIDEPSGDRLFRRAWLRPLEGSTSDEPPMLTFRERVRELMAGPRLRRMVSADAVLECIDRDEVPTSVLIELVGFAVLLDEEARYSVLAEADCTQRAAIVDRALMDLDQLIRSVDRQRHLSWPKGLSFN